MAGKAQLFFTENFTANLDEIQSFLSVEGRLAFQRLLDRLFDDLGPPLTRFLFQAGLSWIIELGPMKRKL